MIKPKEAETPPIVAFDRKDEKECFWTLLMTNPDGHFTQDSSEYLHWMVGNIPPVTTSSEIQDNSDSTDINIASLGETVCPYLQPFPPFGTGFHRFVFILYKHVSNYLSRGSKILQNFGFKLGYFLH